MQQWPPEHRLELNGVTSIMGGQHQRWLMVGAALWISISSISADAKPKRAPEVTPPPDPIVHYDRGNKKGARNFLPSDDCTETPCVVTQHGAFQFPPEVVGNYIVRMNYIHENVLRQILLFQESTTLEQKFAERLLNRYPNRKAINLMHMVDAGKISTIYIYGLLLQNDFSEGDLISVSLTDTKDHTCTKDYFYRFHRTGAVPDIDLALLYPIEYYKPNPGNVVQGTIGGAAISMSVGTNMDPNKKYNWFSKTVRAVRLNLFTGIITRKQLGAIGGDNVTQDKIDGFSGIGVTLFEFINAGYGVNWTRTPHTFFPFVGIEVKHIYDFFRSLKPDSHSRWIKYMKEEQGRPLLQH